MGQHHTSNNSDVAIQQQQPEASTSSLASSSQNLIEPTPPLTPRSRKQRATSNLNLSTESLSSQTSNSSQQTVKILLLGLNGAGKSTIIKKLKEYITAKNSLQDENLVDHSALNKTFRDIIHFHALNGIKQLILASEKLDISILPRHSEQKNEIEFAISYLSNLHFRYGEHVLTSEVARLMKLLWEQRGAKEIHSEFIEYRNQQAHLQQLNEKNAENQESDANETKNDQVEKSTLENETSEIVINENANTTTGDDVEPTEIKSETAVETSANEEKETESKSVEIVAAETTTTSEVKESIENTVETTTNEITETIETKSETNEAKEITTVETTPETTPETKSEETTTVETTPEATPETISNEIIETPVVAPRVDTEEEDVRAVAINDKHFNAGEINCFTLYKDLYNLDFFMDNIDRISEFDYVPTDDDVKYCQTHLKEEKKGIEEIEFEFSGSRYTIYCVEGQNNDGRKWLFLFQGVDIVLFLCPIGDFDVIPSSLDRKNIVRESLDFFSKMCNSKWFRNTPVILLLSKWDSFREKITNTPLTFCFEDYDGDHHSYQHALKFLISKFNHVRDKEGKGLINTNIYQQFSTMDMNHEELANNLGGTIKNIRIEQKEKERKQRRESAHPTTDSPTLGSSSSDATSPNSPSKSRSASVNSPSSASTPGSEIKHKLFAGLLQKLKKK